MNELIEFIFFVTATVAIVWWSMLVGTLAAIYFLRKLTAGPHDRPNANR